MNRNNSTNRAAIPGFNATLVRLNVVMVKVATLILILTFQCHPGAIKCGEHRAQCGEQRLRFNATLVRLNDPPTTLESERR